MERPCVGCSVSYDVEECADPRTGEMPVPLIVLLFGSPEQLSLFLLLLLLLERKLPRASVGALAFAIVLRRE